MSETSEPQALPAGFKPVVSSNIRAVAFMGPLGEILTEGQEPPAQGILGILFTNGTRYHYHGVQAPMFQELLTAESVGKFFNTNIKGQDQYHGSKVDPITGLALTQEHE